MTYLYDFVGKDNVIRGIETRNRSVLRVQSMYILRTADHAVNQSEEKWVFKEANKRILLARNVDTDKLLRIPISAVLPAVRTQSRLSKMNLEDELDYVVVEYFDGLDEMIPGYSKSELKTKVENWRKYVEARLGTVLISRRFVLGVSGTVHLCYYSSKTFVGPGMAWDVKNLTDEKAKLVTIWLNSAPNISQMLVNKIHDVWIDFHKYVLKQTLLPNFDSMTSGARNKLLMKFDTLKDISFVPLHEQFSHQFPARRELDELVMRSIGYGKDETIKLLDELYNALTTEFEKIQQLMPGSIDLETEDDTMEHGS